MTPRCTWLEPSRTPRECGEPAEWIYTYVYEGVMPEFRCKRHAPRSRDGWQPVRVAA